MSERLKRASSYQRLIERLKRNPSERFDPEDWPRPKTYRQVWHHALKGGARGFILAYGVRAGVNFCLYLIRVIRKKAPIGKIFEASLKSLDAFRFAAMFGSFSFLWKSVNNGLRLYRKKDDRLNGLISGAVAGLSILFEKEERRIDLAQQLLVRNGDALLFAITCAQVLYAYTMRPDTLPPDFYSFMVKTARCPKESLLLNHENVRGFPVTPQHAIESIRHLRPTPHALKTLSQLPLDAPAIPCEALHPWLDDCHLTAVERFIKVFKSFLPIYGTLHFVPMFLLRTQHLRKDPLTMLSKTTKATLRSGAFLATFVTLYQYQICMHRQLLKTGLLGRLNSKYLYGLAGFFCSYPAIFIEDKKRRSELALYVLPKAVQSFYSIAYSHQWIFKLKYFEVLMASTAMGIIMTSVHRSQEAPSFLMKEVGASVLDSQVGYMERDLWDTLEKDPLSHAFLQRTWQGERGRQDAVKSM
ncbi:hypothetical protein RO3G_14487 [Rhizopus delemar RA 99-880]|uniref:Transmembrane protein 135 N-terminal domain-containing protein n=1 Tax=Rhizopus delemar (strain RA 99-880 / ATCC MYA-4621 / FGSC 9543 / NRRL 43880) TaxID=246409 RepID=I1CMU6_RHIO9|nr:hypothetical protein RO3G_14487 [Rhizopus delemar RA 99-880]|eukprot:EIE89776.1 hypothetical protein RO3G_14487 [Rhizopus delemar RA 99-880]